MSEQEIIEGNKLIAEFMGWEISGPGFASGYENPHNAYCHFEDLQFYSSWDWLMPVLTNIEKNFWVTTTTRRGYSAVSIHQPQKGYEKIARVDSENKLEATWSAIVEFIKWYNTQNK